MARWKAVVAALCFLSPQWLHGESGHDHHNHGKGHAGHKMGGAAAFDKGMQPILAEYLKIHERLFAGKIDGFGALAKKIGMLSKKLDPALVSGAHAGHYAKVPANLAENATWLGQAKDITAAREAFKKLSQPMAMWVGMAKPKGYAVKYCPMVKASWVQSAGQTRNPYDESMPGCGSDV